MISDSHPLYQAQLIAQFLDNDPVMCRQVKEHLSEERLLDLFELKPEVVESPCEDLEEVMLDFTYSETLRALMRRFTKSELAEMAEELVAK